MPASKEVGLYGPAANWRPLARTIVVEPDLDSLKNLGLKVWEEFGDDRQARRWFRNFLLQRQDRVAVLPHPFLAFAFHAFYTSPTRDEVMTTVNYWEHNDPRYLTEATIVILYGGDTLTPAERLDLSQQAKAMMPKAAKDNYNHTALIQMVNDFEGAPALDWFCDLAVRYPGAPIGGHAFEYANKIDSQRAAEALLEALENCSADYIHGQGSVVRYSLDLPLEVFNEKMALKLSDAIVQVLGSDGPEKRILIFSLQSASQKVEAILANLPPNYHHLEKIRNSIK